LLISQAFSTTLDHVTLLDYCARRQELSDTLVSQSVVSSYVTAGEWVAGRIDIDPTALETVSHHTRVS